MRARRLTKLTDYECLFINYPKKRHASNSPTHQTLIRLITVGQTRVCLPDVKPHPLVSHHVYNMYGSPALATVSDVDADV